MCGQGLHARFNSSSTWVPTLAAAGSGAAATGSTRTSALESGEYRACSTRLRCTCVTTMSRSPALTQADPTESLEAAILRNGGTWDLLSPPSPPGHGGLGKRGLGKRGLGRGHWRVDRYAAWTRHSASDQAGGHRQPVPRAVPSYPQCQAAPVTPSAPDVPVHAGASHSTFTGV